MTTAAPATGAETGTPAMTGSVRLQDRPLESAPAAPRLTLHDAGATGGQLDGAWWPRSDVLAYELPGLLAVLTDRVGPIERLSYDMADWAPADRRLDAGGRRVRLDGFRRRTPGGTVHAVGIRHGVLTLLVIPPTTPTETATAMLERAADPSVTLAALRGEPTGGGDGVPTDGRSTGRAPNGPVSP